MSEPLLVLRVARARCLGGRGTPTANTLRGREVDPDRYLHGRRATDPGANHLFLAEYESLRDESARAREAQQRIIEWTIGAFAVVFVGVLALGDTESGGTTLLRLLIFGAVLPLLLIASSNGWLWELYRMERAGAYLRCRELGAQASEAPDETPRRQRLHDPVTFPLMWENSISTRAKEAHNFAAGFSIFAAGFTICLVVASVELWTEHSRGWDTWIWQALVAVPPLLFLLSLPLALEELDPGLVMERPVVESLAVVAQAGPKSHVRPRDKAVEGHALVVDHDAHRVLPNGSRPSMASPLVKLWARQS